MAKEEVKIPTAQEVIEMYRQEIGGNNINALRVVSFYMDEKCEQQMKFQDIIKLFLDCNAILDETFEKYYKKAGKALDRCTAFIFDEMRKLAEKNVAVGSNKQVFGLAVHYYEEDGLAIDKAKPETVKAINDSVKVGASTSMIDMEKQQDSASTEFDLFDL